MMQSSRTSSNLSNKGYHHVYRGHNLYLIQSENVFRMVPVLSKWPPAFTKQLGSRLAWDQEASEDNNGVYYS